MKIKGWDLKFFNSGEWQVCDERLKDLEKVNRRIGSDGYNPGRTQLFAALRALPSRDVRVAIIGQDPYPQREFATGLAFSVPDTVSIGDIPPTLRTIFKEYCSDLGLPFPSTCSLEKWTHRGVLLWNCIPSCGTSGSLSHDWAEWEVLSQEIVKILSDRGIVFLLVGATARRLVTGIDVANNTVLTVSHPSPRGQINTKTPFLGSRIFSTINDKLVSNGLEPIDWRL